MAGPLTIQRWPWALGNLLGLQGGITPSELAPQTLAVVDSSWMYKIPQIKNANGNTAAVGGEGTFSPTGNETTVPQGELWEVISILAQSTTSVAAATVYGLAPAIIRANGVPEPMTQARQTITGDGTNRLFAGFSFAPGQIILRPTEIACGVCVDNWVAGGGNSAFNCSVWYYRYLI